MHKLILLTFVDGVCIDSLRERAPVEKPFCVALMKACCPVSGLALVSRHEAPKLHPKNHAEQTPSLTRPFSIIPSVISCKTLRAGFPVPQIITVTSNCDVPIKLAGNRRHHATQRYISPRSARHPLKVFHLLIPTCQLAYYVIIRLCVH